MKQENQTFSRRKRITISGATICTLGVLLLFLQSWFVELLTTSLFILKPNSLFESNWRYVADVPVNFHLFNWTNAEDFHNLTIKPRFEEIGPYKFIEDVEKVNVTWNSNNTVTYTQARYLHFDETGTNKNMSAPITTVNLATSFMAHLMRYTSYLAKKLVSFYVLNVHDTYSTKQLLYEGFENFLMDIRFYLPFVFEDLPRFKKFSLLSMVNESVLLEGIFNIANGVDGTFDIRNWNFNNVTPYFQDSCAQIYGSTGELFPKKLSKTYIHIFLTSLCRNIRLDFEEEVRVKGIVGYKYSVGAGMLDNGTIIPENRCYCNGDCIPSGMINMSSCRYGLPLFLSLPNFYDADPIYLESIEGLHPDKSKHEAYIIIEPNTGIPLQTAIRVQINVLVHPVEYISVYEDAREVFIPIVWIDQRSALPVHNCILLKMYLMLPDILTGVGSILAVLGIVLICIPFKPIVIARLKKIGHQQSYISQTPEEVPLRIGDKNVVKVVSQNEIRT